VVALLGIQMAEAVVEEDQEEVRQKLRHRLQKLSQGWEKLVHMSCSQVLLGLYSIFFSVSSDTHIEEIIWGIHGMV